MEFKEEKKVNKKKKIKKAIKEAIKEYAFLIAIIVVVASLITFFTNYNLQKTAKADTNEWRVQQEWEIGDNVYVSNITMSDLVRKKIALNYDTFYYAYGNDNFTAGRNVTSDYDQSEQNYLTSTSEIATSFLNAESFKVNGYSNLNEALNTPLNSNITISFNSTFLNNLLQYNFGDYIEDCNNLFIAFDFMSYDIEVVDSQKNQKIYNEKLKNVFICNRVYTQDLVFNITEFLTIQELNANNWYFSAVWIGKSQVDSEQLSYTGNLYTSDYYPYNVGNIARFLDDYSAESNISILNNIAYNGQLDLFTFDSEVKIYDLEGQGAYNIANGVYKFNSTFYESSGETWAKGLVYWGGQGYNFVDINKLCYIVDANDLGYQFFAPTNTIIDQYSYESMSQVGFNEQFRYLIANNLYLGENQQLSSYSNTFMITNDYSNDTISNRSNVADIMLSYNVYNANEYYSDRELNETINNDLTNLIILTVLGFAIGGIISLATGGALAPLIYGGLTGLIFGVLPVVGDTISSLIGNAFYKVFDGVRKIIQVVTDFIRPAIEQVIQVPQRIFETITSQSPFVRSIILILICVAVFALIGYLIKVSRRRNANR